MRTLLISIFFWSLAQLALADTTPEPWDGCGTTFACYIPEKCSLSSTLTTIGRSKTYVLLKDWVENGKMIYGMKPNCEALIRVHAYANHWAFVSIESFDAAITWIQFYNEESEKLPNDPSKSFKFSCKKSEEPENSGQWKLKGTYGPHKDSQNTEIEITYDPIPQMIKCDFQVLISKKNKVFGDKFRVQIKINGNEHTVYNSLDMPTIGCDPSLYKNGGESEKNELKVYREVKYNFGEFSCDDSEIFKMESRLDATTPTAPFIAVNSIQCENDGKIKITPNPKPDDKPVDLAEDDLEIRCVADARFFCNEGVKAKPNKKALIHVKADIKYKKNDIPAPKPSSLKCPDDEPHLVVRENEKPIQKVNSKLECLSRGTKQLWAIERKIFLDNNQAYYCTKDLECHLNVRIAESAVSNGDLDTKTFVPKCSMNGITGILYVKRDGGKNVEIEEPSCNLKTGIFEYKVKGGQIEEITNSTKFECTYPLEKDENMGIGAAKAAGYSALAVGIAAAIGGAIICVMFFYAARKRRLVKKRQKEQEEREKEIGDNVWIRYCMDKEEKAKLAAKVGDEKVEENTPQDLDEVYNWNRMLMTFQRDALECLGANKEGKYQETEKAIQMPLNSDIPKRDAEKHYSRWLITECAYESKSPVRAVQETLDVYRYTIDLEPFCELEDEIKEIERLMISDPKEVKFKLNRKPVMEKAPPPPAGP